MEPGRYSGSALKLKDKHHVINIWNYTDIFDKETYGFPIGRHCRTNVVLPSDFGDALYRQWHISILDQIIINLHFGETFDNEQFLSILGFRLRPNVSYITIFNYIMPLIVNKL